MNCKKIIAMAISLSIMIPTVTLAKDNPNKGANNGRNMESHKNVQAFEHGKSSKPALQYKAKVQSKSDDEQNKGQEQKKKNEEKRDIKKQQITEFKTAMRAKHEQMKDIKDQTKAVRQQIEEKATELKSIMKEIQEGKKTLPQDMIDALIAKSKELKSDSSRIEPAEEINKVVTDTQDKVEKKDFNNALSSMDKVIAKLQARLDALKKLNSTLDEALAIANLAVEPSSQTPAETPADTPSVTPQPQDDTTTVNN